MHRNATQWIFMEPLKVKSSRDHGGHNDGVFLSVTLELSPTPGFSETSSLSSSLEGSWLLVPQQEVGTRNPVWPLRPCRQVKAFLECLSFVDFFSFVSFFFFISAWFTPVALGFWLFSFTPSLLLSLLLFFFSFGARRTLEFWELCRKSLHSPQPLVDKNMNFLLPSHKFCLTEYWGLNETCQTVCRSWYHGHQDPSAVRWPKVAITGLELSPTLMSSVHTSEHLFALPSHLRGRQYYPLGTKTSPETRGVHNPGLTPSKQGACAQTVHNGKRCMRPAFEVWQSVCPDSFLQSECSFFHSALIQFFKLFPEYATNNFYVTGEVSCYFIF